MTDPTKLREADKTSWPTTTAEKFYILADVIESKPPCRVNMLDWHSECGTAHCAFGWGEVIGLFPRFETTDERFDYMQNDLGLTWGQSDHCFGSGSQFLYLNRHYTPADVARHLRETARELES